MRIFEFKNVQVQFDLDGLTAIFIFVSSQNKVRAEAGESEFTRVWSLSAQERGKVIIYPLRARCRATVDCVSNGRCAFLEIYSDGRIEKVTGFVER